MRLCFAACITAALVCPVLFALDPARSLTQYTHRIWSQEEGLFQPTVYSILQSRDGYLWLGTQDSLIRFDGLRFREFDDLNASAGRDPAPPDERGTSADLGVVAPRTHPNGAPLHRALVRALLEDAAGNLWAGTIGSGLVRIAPDGTAKRFGPAEGFPGANAFCLDRGNSYRQGGPEQDGNDIWVCATDSLIHYRNGSFTAIGKVQGLPAATPRATCATPAGTRWVATDAGLAMIVNGRAEPYRQSRLLPPGEPANALQCDRDGTVWAGTNRGLLGIDQAGARLYTTRDGLPDNAVLTLAKGSDDTLWIGSNDGVSRLRKGVLSVYRTRDGLSHSLVYSLFEDREGSLWAGTKNGLDQWTDGVVLPFSTSEGLSDVNAGPLIEDKRGRIWAGTLTGGLNVFENGRFHGITQRDGLLSNQILSLAVTPDGDLWAGMPRGVSRLRGNKVIRSYTQGQGFPIGSVRSLTVDLSGTLWAATGAGVVRWNGYSFVSGNLWNGGRAPEIVALFPGLQAKLFVSTAEPAVALYRDGQVTSYTPDTNRPADCLFLDRERREAWLGTLGNGLLRWKAGVFQHVRVKDGLYDNRIYGILRDDDRNFWLASSKGIFRVSQSELDAFADGRRQFVNSSPFTTGQVRFECQSGVQPAAIRARDGRLWFSTNNGFVTVNPRDLSARRIAPPVTSIQAVLVNGRPVKFSHPSADLRLSPRERNIEILYAGLSFVSPEKLSFRYTLDGFQGQWTEAGTRREVSFTNLPPGHFAFKVQSRNPDGEWGREATVLPFTVEPRLYQRRWFSAALALTLILVAVSLYRLRIRALQRRFQLVVAERNRIARELHDTLLQGLSGITMQLHAVWTKLPSSKEKQWLEQIIEDASRASVEARRCLRDLRAPQGMGSGFHAKLEKVVRETTVNSSLAVRFRGQPVSFAGAPEIEFQLLRIAAEAAANAVNHSGAENLSVSWALRRRSLSLRMADDGIGFNPSLAQAAGHYGLTGMRERAREIHAHLTVESAPGAGTIISVELVFGRSVRPWKEESNLAVSHSHHND